MCALALALVNAIVKPVVEVLSLPLTIVTLGIFYLVINAMMLNLASGLSVSLFGSGIEIDSFGAAMMGAIVISLASMIIGPIISG
jgi:putative membrane protein